MPTLQPPVRPGHDPGASSSPPHSPGRGRGPRPAPKPLSPAKQVLFSLFALLLVLGLVEGSVRLYHAVRNAVPGEQEEARGYAVEDPEVGYTLKPGYRGGVLRINSLGFRGPEITPEKASGTYRIVALGDSVTFGPHEEECAYPHLLSERLAPGQVEVVNAGVEGYRSDRALIRLRRDVLPLKPDLVTVLVGWNDLYQTNPTAESEQLAIRGNPLAQVLAMSDAAQTFRRWYFLRANAARGVVEQSAGSPELLASYRPEGYAERLREIFRTARAGGADVLTLTWPTVLSDAMTTEALGRVHYPYYTNQVDELRTLYARYQATVREVAAQEGVPVIEAAAPFASSDTTALFKDTLHFSCEGHLLVADQLAAALRAGVVPSYR